MLRSKKKFCLAGVTYTIIARCLHKGEDIVVQHFAAKTVENVATTSGRHCVKFATNDTAQVWIAFVVQVRLLLIHTIKIFTKFTLLVENALCLKQVCMRCKWLLISLLFAFNDNEWNDTHIFVARIIIKETCPETTWSQTTGLCLQKIDILQKKFWTKFKRNKGLDQISLIWGREK